MDIKSLTERDVGKIVNRIGRTYPLIHACWQAGGSYCISIDRLIFTVDCRPEFGYHLRVACDDCDVAVIGWERYPSLKLLYGLLKGNIEQQREKRMKSAQSALGAFFEA